MKRIAVLTLLFLCSLAPSASAGKIFGDIKIDGKPVPEGVSVRIALAGKGAVLDSVKTDKFGAYKLTVKPEGKCTLTLVHDKQVISLDVFSYAEATRYDLVLEKKEGKLTVRRK